VPGIRAPGDVKTGEPLVTLAKVVKSHSYFPSLVFFLFWRTPTQKGAREYFLFPQEKFLSEALKFALLIKLIVLLNSSSMLIVGQDADMIIDVK